MIKIIIFISVILIFFIYYSGPFSYAFTEFSNYDKIIITACKNYFIFNYRINSSNSFESFLSKNISHILIRDDSEKSKITSGFLLKRLVSQRETELTAYLSKVLSFKKDTEHFFENPKTVENHKNIILQKSGKKCKIKILRYATKNRMIEL
jgi:DNA-binding NarL/FixJ family response regulator